MCAFLASTPLQPRVTISSTDLGTDPDDKMVAIEQLDFIAQMIQNGEVPEKLIIMTSEEVYLGQLDKVPVGQRLLMVKQYVEEYIRKYISSNKLGGSEAEVFTTKFHAAIELSQGEPTKYCYQVLDFGDDSVDGIAQLKAAIRDAISQGLKIVLRCPIDTFSTKLKSILEMDDMKEVAAALENDTTKLILEINKDITPGVNRWAGEGRKPGEVNKQGVLGLPTAKYIASTLPGLDIASLETAKEHLSTGVKVLSREELFEICCNSPLRILGIGSQTNLQILFAAIDEIPNPDLRNALCQQMTVFMMGGNVGTGGRAKAEFNIKTDIPAAIAVANFLETHAIKTYLFPKDITVAHDNADSLFTVKITPGHELLLANTDLQRAFSDFTSNFCAYQDSLAHDVWPYFYMLYLEKGEAAPFREFGTIPTLQGRIEVDSTGVTTISNGGTPVYFSDPSGGQKPQASMGSATASSSATVFGPPPLVTSLMFMRTLIERVAPDQKGAQDAIGFSDLRIALANKWIEAGGPDLYDRLKQGIASTMTTWSPAATRVASPAMFAEVKPGSVPLTDEALKAVKKAMDAVRIYCLRVLEDPSDSFFHLTHAQAKPSNVNVPSLDELRTRAIGQLNQTAGKYPTCDPVISQLQTVIRAERTSDVEKLQGIISALSPTPSAMPRPAPTS